MNKEVQLRQVIHLHILETDQHQYYGSIMAMFDHHTREDLGVAAQTLYNSWKDEIYRNDKIVIRKGKLLQKKMEKVAKDTGI